MVSRRARITELTCQVASALEYLVDPQCDITVERVYSFGYPDQEQLVKNPELAAQFTGRRIYVAGLFQRQEGPASREEDFNDYGVMVSIIERYEGDEPRPPNEWMDERTAWVEEKVVRYLGNPREPVIENAEPLTQDWTVYVPTMCEVAKLFYSEFLINFRRAEEP